MIRLVQAGNLLNPLHDCTCIDHLRLWRTLAGLQHSVLQQTYSVPRCFPPTPLRTLSASTFNRSSRELERVEQRLGVDLRRGEPCFHFPAPHSRSYEESPWGQKTAVQNGGVRAWPSTTCGPPRRPSGCGRRSPDSSARTPPTCLRGPCCYSASPRSAPQARRTPIGPEHARAKCTAQPSFGLAALDAARRDGLPHGGEHLGPPIIGLAPSSLLGK
jgi:hypothetical protein